MTDTTLSLCKGSINNIARIIEFLASIVVKCAMLVVQVILIIPMLLCSLVGIGLLAGFLSIMLLSVYYAVTLL